MRCLKGRPDGPGLGPPMSGSTSMEIELSHLLLGPVGHLWAPLRSSSFAPKLDRGGFSHLQLKGLWHVEGWESGSRGCVQRSGVIDLRGTTSLPSPAQLLAQPGDLSFNPISIPCEKGAKEKRRHRGSVGIGKVLRAVGGHLGAPLLSWSWFLC